jgi:DNA end-binding protein Ku
MRTSKAPGVESSSTLNVQKFVEESSIDPDYNDSSYYVAPDGDAGKDVFVVLRDAIASTGRVALSRVTIAGRERAIAIMPMEGGLIAHTLNEERDLNDPKPLFEDLKDIKSDPEMVQLARQLIDRQTGKYDPADVEDRYEARLRDVIDAKLKGEGIEPAEEEPDRSKVIDLMAALRQSLGQGGGKAPSKKGASDKSSARTKPPSKPKATPAKLARKPARKRA